MAEVIPQSLDVRAFDSGAIQTCYLAWGKLDVYLEQGVYNYDLAVGVVILEETDGRYRALEGDPWDLSSDSILAANPSV